MSPQNDVNRLVKLPRLAKREQLIFALDSSFDAPNPGTRANRAQGERGALKCKRARLSATPSASR